MSYFVAKDIRDRLAESADKNLFGNLKGSAGSWDRIVRAYEKQSTYTTPPLHAFAQCTGCPTFSIVCCFQLLEYLVAVRQQMNNTGQTCQPSENPCQMFPEDNNADFPIATLRTSSKRCCNEPNP